MKLNRKITGIITLVAVSLAYNVFYGMARSPYYKAESHSATKETGAELHFDWKTIGALEKSCQGVSTFTIDKRFPHPFDLVNYNSKKGVKSMMEHFYRYTNLYTDANCEETERAGILFDGGWDICVAPPYRPQPNNCKVLSFGINYRFSFDDYMAEHYNCTVHSHDPSMEVGDHLRGERVWFHRVGLGGRDTIFTHPNMANWTILKYTSILKRLNWTNEVVDVLKFDIEGNEKYALDNMLSENALSNVKQLAFEMHTGGLIARPENDRVIFVNLQKRLREAGFRRYMVHENSMCVRHIPKLGPRCTCVEVYYINKRFLEDISCANKE